MPSERILAIPGPDFHGLEQPHLFDRIWGSMLGRATGDAMSGPVEGLTYDRVITQYERVADLLPYPREGESCANGSTAPGSITDDTRVAARRFQRLEETVSAVSHLMRRSEVRP